MTDTVCENIWHISKYINEVQRSVPKGIKLSAKFSGRQISRGLLWITANSILNIRKVQISDFNVEEDLHSLPIYIKITIFGLFGSEVH